MRFLTAAALVGGLALSANAHFVFVYVPDDQPEARLVFGHAAAPDPSAFPTRAEKTTLSARDAAGKDTKLAVEKGDGNFFRAKLPAEKPVVVYGTTEAGVTQRGDNPPVLSWYYPKVVLGDPFAKGTVIGADAPLEVVPVRDGEKVRFRVTVAGKPLADSEVTVGLPNKGEDKDPLVKTDKDGLTEGFADRGRYCVAARRVEDKAGEFGGKKYASVRHTATLVFDFASGK
ncbi:Uncharacterized protein OS=Phycisphaera mikurensis (strain NBRC 102666 / KCTC 22515 / FYK2301M01) GN=PSMK_26110 PE=4 SV=1: DUF4198 [Gemmataceae bacterium]|nr:Uncharacterized protein OS=Phycisphaera mikurensis (strain NBRC 102666 / KCTC 22515 / FYK2301M01) GN=PSMK_26110 PE=4 SV=1: DUF4198 [Gemmataceae bacterium]VTT99233.1 Uncharacterized protein OS=Phycisphaera mikurensis (strain NBRC 102666 / KCTC 22515 / FYK2301M01) GN=PSMK_26110 PE=4 SV=1: DUF4198 [Gemmataceae bacterium]